MPISIYIEHVRVGDEVFHDAHKVWRVVTAISAVPHGFHVTFSNTFEGGVIEDTYARGSLVLVPRSPYFCTECGSASRGGSVEDFCECGASSWTAAGWVCPDCGRAAQQEFDRCTCGSRRWVWGKLPPTPLSALEQRILDAVRTGQLANANAVVRQIGGRRQDVYAVVKALLADGRLCFVDDVLRVR